MRSRHYELRHLAWMIALVWGSVIDAPEAAELPKMVTAVLAEARSFHTGADATRAWGEPWAISTSAPPILHFDRHIEGELVSVGLRFGLPGAGATTMGPAFITISTAKAVPVSELTAWLGEPLDTLSLSAASPPGGSVSDRQQLRYDGTDRASLGVAIVIVSPQGVMITFGH
jgi:hypothetical protein